MTGETIMLIILIILHVLGGCVFYFSKYCPNMHSDITVRDFNNRRSDFISYFTKMVLFLTIIFVISLGV